MNENKQLIQQVFAELGAGNAQPFTDVLADDVQWTIIGSTKWSKTFAGKAAVLAERPGALADQRRVLAHLRDRHAGAPQAIHEVEPGDMEIRVHPAAPAVSRDAGDQPLRFIPTDRVNAAAAARRQFADFHTGSPSAASTSAVSRYSVSSCTLPFATR